MRLIAIASEDSKGLKGQVSAHFGRCPYYTLVETEDGKVLGRRVVVNPHYAQHQPGVMPQMIKSLGADVILAGGMGPRAANMFQDYGVEVATGAEGAVGDALEDYLQGRIRGFVPCRHDHPESCGGHSTEASHKAKPTEQPASSKKRLPTQSKRLAIHRGYR